MFALDKSCVFLKHLHYSIFSKIKFKQLFYRVFTKKLHTLTGKSTDKNKTKVINLNPPLDNFRDRCETLIFEILTFCFHLYYRPPKYTVFTPCIIHHHINQNGYAHFCRFEHKTLTCIN